ncbi:phytanoyl-CoA dioxygenase family protein [Cadophora sp. MPI-SDFR-AT-0126]|nr:phytanoyl-CoA dioxygenase family protein [Leotiomycetes sp. MPI-SDFR-AT-0126]
MAPTASPHVEAAPTPPTLTSITLSPSELSSKTLTSHHLQAALEALHRDGILVLTNGISTTHLDTLNSRMVPEAQTLYDRKSTHHNFGTGTGNIQQDAIVDPSFIFDDIIANPFATAITECMLGPNPHLRFQSANTAFKAEKRQPVHVDVHFDFPKIPFGICVNINLIDVDPEHGSTEIWLGSHLDTSWKAFVEKSGSVIPEDILERRRKISPPIQPVIPKGALILRDLRLWHAGMPNRTEDVRVMLVTIHFPAWYRTEQKVLLPESLKGKIEWGNLVPCVEWVPDGYDYLQGQHDHDFDLLP